MATRADVSEFDRRSSAPARDEPAHEAPGSAAPSSAACVSIEAPASAAGEPAFGRPARPGWGGRLLREPTSLGVLIVAATFAFVCGFAVHPQALVPAYCLTAAIVVGSLRPWLDLRGLSAECAFPVRRLREGDVLAVRVRIRNRWPWPIEGIVLTCGDLPDAPPYPCDRIPARGVLEIVWRMTPAVRGRFPRHGLTIATSFPFGLREFRRTIPCTAPPLVWTRRLPATSLVPHVGGRPHPIGGSLADRAGNEGETTGVRAYRQGDSLRQIHWNRTAQCDEPMVRERQSPAASPWRILLDGSPEVHRGDGPDSTLEWSVRIVAALIETAVAKGIPVEALLPGLRLKCDGRPGELRRIRDALAEWAAPTAGGFDDLRAVAGSPPPAQVVEWVVTTDLRRDSDGACSSRLGRMRWVPAWAVFGGTPAGIPSSEPRSGGSGSPEILIGEGVRNGRAPHRPEPVRIEFPRAVAVRRSVRSSR